MSGQSRILSLRKQYLGYPSLKTTDDSTGMSLLSKFSARTAKVSPNSVKREAGLFMCELKDVLFHDECNEIIEEVNKSQLLDMSEKYGDQRNNHRLLVLDEGLAKNLWLNIQPVLANQLEKLQIPIQPLGFDVTRGKWELHGLNEAMRINYYIGDNKQYFGPHKDAQYCPSGDERSLFTLLVYLNDNFKGGETCFYFPKDVTQDTRYMTIQQEIDALSGLTKGFNHVKYTPKTGHAVLFSQNMLHESLPMQKGFKYVLKTDIVAKRHSKQFGFAVEVKEKNDYLICLNYFKEAQQQELQRNNSKASDLYEKALSVRYSYPKLLSSSQPILCNDSKTSHSFVHLLPLSVWHEIFQYLHGKDLESLVYAYPPLNLVKVSWERHQYLNANCLSNARFLPNIKYHKGILTCFEFPDAGFFEENESGCCRVAAMYSFFLLGQKPDDDVYTVRYNPDTRDVCVVALETLLTDVFYNRRCYGSFYNVRQQDAVVKDAKKDFESSVDRTYMLLRHGAEFTGVELQQAFTVTSEADRMSNVCSSEDESDDSDDSDDSDNGDNGDGGSDHIDDDGDHVDGDKEEKSNKKQKALKCEENIKEKKDDQKPKVITDGTVPFNGEINDCLCVMGIIRYHHRMRDREKNSDQIDFDDIMDETEDNGSTLFFDTLEEIIDTKNTVSCALVSNLKKTLNVEESSVCVCMHGPDEKMLEYIGDSCATEFYNHLVFDFETSELSVLFVMEEDCKKEPFHDYYYECITQEQELMGCIGNTKSYKVDIKPLLSSGTSFNHASCQCGNARFKVDEYYNIKDYPYLDHIYIITRKLNGKMMVWTLYGGIAAL